MTAGKTNRIPFTLAKIRTIASHPEKLGRLIEREYPDDWVHSCHVISLALLRTGTFGPGRIARGWAEGVGGQHSWIVLDDDVYNADAIVVDPVLFSYDENVSGIWTGYNQKRHHPHGEGSIWNYGRPQFPEETVIELTPATGLSHTARGFLDLLGPLDRKGWMQLANGPMQGWPSGEIIAAMDDTRQLAAYVPIDILGMLTCRNPRGLYQ